MAAIFGAGAAGLLAGVFHPRVGHTESGPFGYSLVGGMGLGTLGSGLLALAQTVAPDLSPSWASYDALATVVSWLDLMLERIPAFTGLTLGLLLGAVALHRWTEAGRTRRWGAIGTVTAAGFITAGVTSASSLSAWALSGVVLALLFGLGYLAVVRYDRSVLPMVGATVVGLGIVKTMITATHLYAVSGESLALFIVLGGSIWWTRVLRRQQRNLMEDGENGEAEGKL